MRIFVRVALVAMLALVAASPPSLEQGVSPSCIVENGSDESTIAQYELPTPTTVLVIEGWSAYFMAATIRGGRAAIIDFYGEEARRVVQFIDVYTPGPPESEVADTIILRQEADRMIDFSASAPIRA